MVANRASRSYSVSIRKRSSAGYWGFLLLPSAVSYALFWAVALFLDFFLAPAVPKLSPGTSTPSRPTFIGTAYADGGMNTSTPEAAASAATAAAATGSPLRPLGISPAFEALIAWDAAALASFSARLKRLCMTASRFSLPLKFLQSRQLQVLGLQYNVALKHSQYFFRH